MNVSRHVVFWILSSIALVSHTIEPLTILTVRSIPCDGSHGTSHLAAESNILTRGHDPFVPCREVVLSWRLKLYLCYEVSFVEKLSLYQRFYNIGMYFASASKLVANLTHAFKH